MTFGVLNLFHNQILCARCAAVQFGRLDAQYCSYIHYPMLCGLTAGSSCVIGSYVRACENIYTCCDPSHSVELTAQTANVAFMFKV